MTILEKTKEKLIENYPQFYEYDESSKELLVREFIEKRNEREKELEVKIIMEYMETTKKKEEAKV